MDEVFIVFGLLKAFIDVGKLFVFSFMLLHAEVENALVDVTTSQCIVKNNLRTILDDRLRNRNKSSGWGIFLVEAFDGVKAVFSIIRALESLVNVCDHLVFLKLLSDTELGCSLVNFFINLGVFDELIERKFLTGHSFQLFILRLLTSKLRRNCSLLKHNSARILL